MSILTNAGYGLMGALEETTEIEEARANFDTNVFGTFSTIKAALPLLRAQRRGHLLAVSSVGGLVDLSYGEHLPGHEVCR